jgi:hypothetical protein
LIARSAEWAAGEDVTVPVPAAFPTSAATAVRDPLRGIWLKLGLAVNGQHPANDVVVTPGPLRLTLDMEPGLWAEPLDLYYALVVGGRAIWFTAGGTSTTPAPLTNMTPLAFQGIELINNTFPSGTVLTFVMFFADGSTPVALDVISAVVQP